MAGSFLDTTIMVELSDNKPASSVKHIKDYLRNNQPAHAPYYALRELLAGLVQVLCETYNTINASSNVGEAITALAKRNPIEGRKKQARIQVFAEVLNVSFSDNPNGDRSEIKSEMLQALAIRTNQLWRKSQKITSVELTQPLGCFTVGSLSYGAAGELRAPKDSFNCDKEERCSAASYIYEDQITLAKLIEALHPDNLDPVAAEKNENSSRRKALKDLQTNGPKKFSKRNCRAIGDAYFAAMCQPGSDVVTTNTVDHLPLCLALGKKAVKP